MSLDFEYGPAIPAQPRIWARGRQPYDDWERHPPRSLTRLDDRTAPPLKRAMEDIAAGWRIGEVLVKDVSFIWLVDISGQIWIAVEELVVGGQSLGVPKLRHTKADKLGHPALVNCGNARIAGEIICDFDPDPPEWLINNLSARYGTHRSRTDLHLQNVAKVFARFGITLTSKFQS